MLIHRLVGTHDMTHVMQERRHHGTFGFARGLGQLGALQCVVELADRFLTVPGRGAAAQQLLNLRDAQRHMVSS